MSGYYDAGVIDKQTMRQFDETCLTPVHEFTAENIRALRGREHVSQTVFANHLNVTKDSASQWERLFSTESSFLNILLPEEGLMFVCA